MSTSVFNGCICSEDFRYYLLLVLVIVHVIKRHRCSVKSTPFHLWDGKSLSICYLSIYILCHLVPSRTIPQGDGHDRRASTFPYLFASSIPPSLSATLSCMFSFTLCLYFTTVLPLLLQPSISLTYIFFTNSLLFLLSLHMTKPCQINFHPFHCTTVSLC